MNDCQNERVLQTHILPMPIDPEGQQRLNRAISVAQQDQMYQRIVGALDAKPRARILDPDFEYVSAAATDVQRTWRKFGWVPLGEQQS